MLTCSRFLITATTTKPLEEMVGIIQPSYAVICDSEKNPAEKKTVSMLEENGALCRD